MITEIQKDEIKLESLLNTKSKLPLPLQDTLKRECGRYILVDEILQLNNNNPHTKKMALNLLKLETENRITIEPSNFQKSVNFVEKMLTEARKSTSRIALELSASLNNLIEELFSNPFVPESSHVLMTFIRNFQKFSRHFLELKLNER